MDRAALVISIDVEMSWGLIHRPERSYDYPTERRDMRRLLDLFDQYEAPATWAFVGHLMLDGCHTHDGVAHPDLVRPAYEWFDGDWLSIDPCTEADRSSTFYAPDLVAEIRGRDVGHEIGSHSFTHLIAGDPGCSEAAFRSDLQHCRAAAERDGIPMRSFVFPRNQYGHEEALRSEGFTSFRGPRPDPFAGRTSIERRVRQVADTIRPSRSTAVRPLRQHGVWNLPATYLHDVGRPNRYPLRIAQARRRIRQAAEQQSLFHLWFHPHNVQHETERWFAGLETMLRDVAKLRAAGRFSTLTMSGVVEQLDGSASAAVR